MIELILAFAFLLIGVIAIFSFADSGVSAKVISTLCIIGSTTLFVSELYKSKIDRVKAGYENLQELEPGYYKAFLPRKEKDDSLSVLVEDANGYRRLVNIKEGVVGWSEEDHVLRVYIHNGSKLFNFMKSIE